MHARRGNETHRGDVAPEVQEGVELHRSLALAEGGPRERGEAEVDHCRIEGVDGVLQLDPEGLGRIELAGCRNHPLGEVGVDPPVAHLFGMGQGVAGDHAPEAHVVKLGRSHAEPGLDVPQALPEGQLGKRQAEKLVPAGEGLDLVAALVAVHAHTELVRGDEVHPLGEDRPATVHGSTPLAKMREYGPSQVAGSNR